MSTKAMTKHDIPEIAARSLDGQLDQSGAFLYSSHETIKPGEIYFLGLNPGGQGGVSLRERLATLLSREENAYLDEAWDNGGGSYKPGEAPLQKRVGWLLSQLGADTRDVLSTNLIFMQSRDASGVSIEHAKLCWPVHEALLSIVRPRLILTFGNSSFSPYGYLHALYGGSQRYAPSGHGDWSVKGFNAQMSWGEVFVAGLPHLSRYDPTDKHHVVDWIKNGGHE
ncbi:uracil-DNA glycosylase family protein [[Acidovorax] ebreus]|uniref:uracil-DNA glycosylase family protein n=1 Tax=Diaphorobacter sp. LI3 TaxID=2952886 RepID=UPI00205B427F|nr:uracil-DNA glycosylase family protein [Diaphorobacter sp. LI3]